MIVRRIYVDCKWENVKIYLGYTALSYTSFPECKWDLNQTFYWRIIGVASLIKWKWYSLKIVVKVYVFIYTACPGNRAVIKCALWNDYSHTDREEETSSEEWIWMCRLKHRLNRLPFHVILQRTRRFNKKLTAFSYKGSQKCSRLCDHCSRYQMLPFEILRRAWECGYRAMLRCP